MNIRFAIVAVALCTAFSSVFAADAWLDNYKDALAQAKQQNKKVLINFTGSDWCSFCIKLDRETFSKPQFQTFAKKNLVLLKIDFPEKTQLSDEIAEQNKGLAQQYGVRGFPTLVLLNSDGKEIQRNPGYLAGGPAALEKWVHSVK